MSSRVRRTWTCRQLHGQGEGAAKPRAPRDQPSSLHSPFVPHGGALRWAQRRHLHALRLLVGGGDAADGAARVRKVRGRAQPRRHPHGRAPLRGGGWNCSWTGNSRRR